MEKTKRVGGSSSSSSFATDLFGPKEPSKSSTSLFGSVFSSPSMIHGRDSNHVGVRGSSRNQDSGNQYGNAKYGTSDNGSQRSRGDISKDKSSMYQNEKRVEPSYFSSSIYYGGQDVYSPPNHTTAYTNHIVKKDGGDDDQNENNSNCASRGNWWQGSLYY